MAEIMVHGAAGILAGGWQGGDVPGAAGRTQFLWTRTWTWTQPRRQVQCMCSEDDLFRQTEGVKYVLECCLPAAVAE